MWKTFILGTLILGIDIEVDYLRSEQIVWPYPLHNGLRRASSPVHATSRPLHACQGRADFVWEDSSSALSHFLVLYWLCTLRIIRTIVGILDVYFSILGRYSSNLRQRKFCFGLRERPASAVGESKNQASSTVKWEGQLLDPSTTT